MNKILLFLAAVLPLALSAVPLVRAKVLIDGNLNDPVWKHLPWKTSFTVLGSKKAPSAQTRFKTFNDGKYIYFGIECDEPLMNKLRKRDFSEGSELLWMNDSVELNLIPDGKLVSYYKVILDIRGKTRGFIGQDDNTNRDKYLFNTQWHHGAESAVREGKNKWYAEVAIPMGSMDFANTNTDRWRLNVGRNRWTLKRAELSSWSTLSKPNHVVPKDFKTVTIGGFDVNERLIDIEDFKGRSFRKNGRQFYYASVTVHNNTPSFFIFKQKCTLKNIKTNQQYSVTTRIELERNSYKSFNLTVPDIPNGEYLLFWDLNTNRRKGTLYKRMVQKVVISYVPLQILLKRPAYRDNIYASMKDKTIEAVILMPEGKGAPLTVTLAGKNFREVKKIAGSRERNTVIFNGGKLPKGDYTLTANYVQNKRNMQISKRIRVLPYRKGEFFLDAEGIPHVDGKKFLSYGWYANNSREVTPYYNTYLNIARYPRAENMIRSIRYMFNQAKLRSLVIPFQDLSGRNDWKQIIFKDPDTRKKGLTALQRKKIIELVTKVSKEEGLLGYYMADEPECRDNNPVWYEEALALIRELDPYHPCFMLNYGPGGIRRYYKGCDILLPDCYPQYFEDGTTSRPRWAPSDYAKLTTSLRPAAFQMPQASCWPDLAPDRKTKGIPPTVHDFRSQVFQPIAHNVKGINLYAYFDSQRFSSMILTPDAVGKVLHAAKYYLLENSVPDGVKVVTTPHFAHFQTGLKRHNGKLLLIAVNTSMKKLKVDFKMKVRFNGKFYTEGCAQTLSVRNGAFSDTFEPNETKIYFSDRAVASKLEPVKKTLKAVADLKASRKKKGNLVGLGEMFSIEYVRFGRDQKKYGKDTPIITASSDATIYLTRKSGSLYYLVDGLTDPNRIEYSWKPSSRDKNPFVQFRLRKKSPVKEVRLYTPKGNLQSGKVVINGKEYPYVNKGKSNLIVIPITGKVVTDTVRIYCTKYHCPAKAKWGVDTRLLTEVEIY